MTRTKVRNILREEAERHHADFQNLINGRQFKRCVSARNATIVRLRELGLSLPEIGRWLGMHHTSVKAALDRERRAEVVSMSVPDLSGEWAI